MAVYIWETEFITSDNLMIHTFSNRVKVATNIKTLEIKILRDGKTINSRNDITDIKEYTEFLLQTASEAEQLKMFRHE